MPPVKQRLGERLGCFKCGGGLLVGSHYRE
jgi:hypothetical protein